MATAPHHRAAHRLGQAGLAAALVAATLATPSLALSTGPVLARALLHRAALLRAPGESGPEGDLAVGMLGATIPRTPVPTPPVPRRLPAGIEPLADYVQQSSCDPTPKPGTAALGRLLQTTYPGTSFGISRACAFDAMASEHYEGRALDWMVSVRSPAQAAQAQAVISWLFAPDAAGHPYANARRLGVMYLIWDNRIWGAYATAAGWRPYSVCAAHPEASWDTACHRNHIHFSLSWAGAMGHTSFWTGRVAAPDYGPCRPPDLNWAPAYSTANPRPCPRYPAVTPPTGASATLRALIRYSGASVTSGSTGPIVRAVQAALSIPADGSFGRSTVAAVSAFRRSHGLTPVGRMDAATWRALLASFRGRPTPGPTPNPTPTPGPNPNPDPAPGPGSDLRRYAGTTLRYGSSGPAVLALQQALHVQPLSGWFGPVTRAAVQAFQRTHALPASGVVDARTWPALLANFGARPNPRSPLTGYLGTTLQYGSTGPAVLALQRALHVQPLSGWFGPVTQAAVKAYQRAHGLPVTGVVNDRTWHALGA